MENDTVELVALKAGPGYNCNGQSLIYLKPGEKFTTDRARALRMVDVGMAEIVGSAPLEASEDFEDQANAQTDEVIPAKVDGRSKAGRDAKAAAIKASRKRK